MSFAWPTRVQLVFILFLLFFLIVPFPDHYLLLSMTYAGNFLNQISSSMCRRVRICKFSKGEHPKLLLVAFKRV